MDQTPYSAEQWSEANREMGTRYPFYRRRLLDHQNPSLLSGLLLLGLLASCAPAESAATRHAWTVLCANAPFTAGMSISYAEQQAMTHLDVWKLSVKQVNAEGAKR